MNHPNHLKRFFICMLVLAMLPVIVSAKAETSVPDGVLLCSYQGPAETESYLYHLYDGDPFTTMTLKRSEKLTMQIPSGATHLFFDFYESTGQYALDLFDTNGKRISSMKGSSAVGFLDVPLDGTAASATLVCSSKRLVLSDWFACTDDYAPPFPDHEAEADVLVILNTPGDELFKLGGILPMLCGEYSLSVKILYFTAADGFHTHQCMQILQHMGVQKPPVFGTGNVAKNPYDNAVFSALGTSESQMLKQLVEEIRTCRPKLILTLDTEKEQAVYADGTIARAVLKAVSYAAEPSRYPGTEAYETPKLYSLSETGETAICQTVPLSAFGGKTGVEVGTELYQFYREELLYRRKMPETVRFTLLSSTVGDDLLGTDLLEHLSISGQPDSHAVTPAPTVTPAPPETPGNTEPPEATLEPTSAAKPEQTAAAEPEESVHGQERDSITTRTRLWWLPAVIGALLTGVLLVVLFKRSKPLLLLLIVPFLVGIILSALTFAGVLCASMEMCTADPAAQSSAASTDHTVSSDPSASIAESTETPTLPPTQEPTVTPAPTATPDPDAEYFLSGDGEEFELDFENGHWWYKNNALSIDIHEVHTTMEQDHPLIYYVADIRMRDYSSYRSGVREFVQPWRYARLEKAVLAVTGDNLVSAEKEEKGCLIRRGKFYFNSGHSQTLVIRDDLTLSVLPKAISDRVLMDHGVRDSYGFGPTLVENGRIDDATKKHRVSHVNPRIGIGMVEPGHWIVIATEGRQGPDRGNFSYSISLEYFAQMFIDYNCSVAFNMDGGSSVGIVFMGEALNRHYMKGTDDTQRPWNDALLFGYSEQLPSIDTPTIHDGFRHDF